MKQVDENTWWKYIDGECSEEEKLHLDSLLEKDPSLVEDLLLRSTLHKEMEHVALEIPTTNFTENVLAALPEKRTITKIEPLFSPRQMWIGVAALVLCFIGLFTIAFFMEGTSSSSAQSYGFIKEQFSIITETALAYLSQIPIPQIILPTIPDSSIQISLVLIFGTVILLVADKFLGKKLG